MEGIRELTLGFISFLGYKI